MSLRDDVPQPEGSQEDYKQTVEQSIPDFRYSVPYRGDGTRAMAVAQAAFAQAGFRVERMTATELRVVGPGMRGARVDPLRGATLAGVTIGGGEIRVEAALGGAVWVQRLLGLLLGGMAVLFLVGFGIAWAVLPSLRAFAWIWFLSCCHSCRGLGWAPYWPWRCAGQAKAPCGIWWTTWPWPLPPPILGCRRAKTRRMLLLRAVREVHELRARLRQTLRI